MLEDLGGSEASGADRGFLDAAEVPPRWTPEHVGRRLVEAMATLGRLPRPRGPRAPGNHWPAHRLEWADTLAQAELPEAERRERAGARLSELALRPSGRAIDRMDQALDWLRELRGRDAELALVATLWAHRLACGRSLRRLCRERGWAPQTFYKRRARALETLASALTARGTAVS